MIPRRRIVLAAATTVVVLAGHAPAHADSTRVDDRSADVVKKSFAAPDADPGRVLGRGASVDSLTDVRSMRVNHGRHRVSVRLTFARLGPDTRVKLRIQGGAGSRIAHLNIDPQYDTASVFVDDGSNVAEILCTRVPITRRTGRDGSVTVRIARTCLSSPARLRVTAVATTTGSYSNGRGYLLADPVSPEKARALAWSRYVRAG
jgi:hypothetical protein